MISLLVARDTVALQHRQSSAAAWYSGRDQNSSGFADDVREARIKGGNDVLVISLSRRQRPLFEGRQATSSQPSTPFRTTIDPRQQARGDRHAPCAWVLLLSVQRTSLDGLDWQTLRP